MNEQVIFIWRFSPPDYFEERMQISESDYFITIDDGQVEARIDSDIYETRPRLCQELHSNLMNRFLGVQLKTYNRFELIGPTMTRLHPDGRKDYYLDAEPGSFGVLGSTVDFQITEKDGNIVADSKRSRIEEKKKIADQVSTWASDGTLAQLLQSHKAAVDDPNDELVHLYEIRDGLSTKFGGDSEAKSALNITSADWSRLGLLCNNMSLRQGRHRGQTNALRDATQAELDEARRIGRTMVERYIGYLDAGKGRASP